MSRTRSPEESRHPVREKLALWWARLSKPIIPRQGSQMRSDSCTGPAPVPVGQPDSAPKNELPTRQEPRPVRSRPFMKIFSKPVSQKPSDPNEGSAPLVHEQPDDTIEKNVAMPEDKVDQGQASENDVISEIASSSALKPFRTLQEVYPQAPEVEEDLQAKPSSSSSPDQLHQAAEKQTILAKSIQDFAKQRPEMFALLKDQIEHFRSMSVERCDTWSNLDQAGPSENPQTAWVSRCKARLPALSAVKSLAVRLSTLDPHGLAPYIVTGSFVAIELCLGIVDPTNRVQALDTILKASIIITKWESYEVDLVQIRRSKDREIVDQAMKIESLIEKLYEHGLILIASIYNDGMSKSSQAMATMTSSPVKWKKQLDELDLHNSRCTEMKSKVDQMLKRTEGNMVVLNWIRCKDDPEPTHEDMRLKTGLEPTSQDMRQTGFKPVTEEVGEWFLQMSRFSSWVEAIVQERNGANRVCWLRGIMGTGKSTLMCRVVSQYDELPLSGIRFIHYYCDASKAPGTPPSDYEAIIRALCCRLAWDNTEHLAEPASKLHAKYDPKYNPPDSKPTIKEWEVLLYDLIASQRRRVIFVIDALDEYRSLGDCRQLLGLLADMRSKPRCPYILFSSRKHVPVADYFKSDLEVVDLTDNVILQHAQADIKSFIDHAISSKQHDPAWEKSIFLSDRCLRQRLEVALIQSAGGMFRWVQVWLGVFFPKNKKCIEKQSAAEELLIQLETFQTLDQLGEGDEEKAMKTAYTNLWEVNGDIQYQNDQLRAFQIVLAAGRPLTPNQLLEAIRFNPDKPDDYDKTFKLHQLEGLYHNFLKQNERGCLEFEHLSASRFVSELRTDRNEPMFSATQNARFMAEFCVKAFERPEHSIWKVANIDLGDWSRTAREIGFTLMDSEVRPMLTPPREITLHIPRPRLSFPWVLEAIPHQKTDLEDHFAERLLRDWAGHCQTTAKDDHLSKIIALSQNKSSGFDGYLLMVGLGQFLDRFHISEIWEYRESFEAAASRLPCPREPPYHMVYSAYRIYLDAIRSGHPRVKMVRTRNAEGEEEDTVQLPQTEKSLVELMLSAGYGFGYDPRI